MGFDDSLHYFQILKETLDTDEYEAICNALIGFNGRKICAADLIATASAIFLGDKDLVSGFNTFLLEEYRIKPPSHGQYNWFDVKKASVDFFNEIRRAYSYDDYETYKKFLGIMERLDLGNVGDKKAHEEVDALFKDNPALYLEFTWLFVGFKEDSTRRKHHSDDDLKEDPPTKKRKNHHDDVDEDGEVIMKAVCCSRKKKRRHKDEIKLFEWEDRLFEMDMFRSCLSSTISQAEKYLGECCSDEEEEESSCWDMKNYFGMKELQCIVKLYGEVGEHIVELLGSDPVNVLKRAVLPRLRQKLYQTDHAYMEAALSS